MVGGLIVQVLHKHDRTYIECVDLTYFDRCWRECDENPEIKVGDHIWWQHWKGHLTRDAEFEDVLIGTCKPSKHPDNINENHT